MREFSKIENLYKRNPQKKSELIVGEYTRPEFGIIKTWDVTEKVDGTNVQFRFTSDDVQINGRTDRAQFTPNQESFMNDIASNIRGKVLSNMNHFGLTSMTIFGELYGPKIQAGGNYSDKLGFRPFDMLINDRVWLAPGNFRGNVKAFGFENTIPHLGPMTEEEIFTLVANGFRSTFARNEEYLAEGVIAKPLFNMYDQRGSRVLFKLKTCDLRHLHA
jgi:hypothetical protein